MITWQGVFWALSTHRLIEYETSQPIHGGIRVVMPSLAGCTLGITSLYGLGKVQTLLLFLKVKALALGVQMLYMGDSSELRSIVDVIVYKLVAFSSEKQ